ncbi:MAG: flagellar biosynthetic protein FliP [Phycisphaerales bacterium]|nr:MAG: flagellar biosynthetic protein FliP [Phycisphaerales bacterium]
MLLLAGWPSGPMPAAMGQEVFGPPVVPMVPASAGGLDGPALAQELGRALEGRQGGVNPLGVLEAASRALPEGADGRRPGLSAAISIMLVLTVITLVPSIMLMCTSFVRIIIVLGLLKQAMGTQTVPPGQVILGLSLFLTLFVMTPTIGRIYDEAVVPYQRGQIADYEQLYEAGVRPLRDFMFDQIEATGNWSSLLTIMDYRGYDVSDPSALTRADVGMAELVPAYMLSELKVAFLMGFRIYLPFLVIDMVIASVLISMSMMMLPPVLISLPFKLLLFVLADGWQLLAGSLLDSFVLEGQIERLSAQAAMLPLLVLIGPVLRARAGCRPGRRWAPGPARGPGAWRTVRVDGGPGDGP